MLTKLITVNLSQLSYFSSPSSLLEDLFFQLAFINPPSRPLSFYQRRHCVLFAKLKDKLMTLEKQKTLAQTYRITVAGLCVLWDVLSLYIVARVIYLVWLDCITSTLLSACNNDNFSYFSWQRRLVSNIKISAGEHISRE